MQLDPRALVQLAEIIEQQSFSAAADRLGVTQPGLSKTVATLETRLKAKLLAQRRRPVVPTELGRQLAEIGHVIRAAMARAASLAAESASGVSGHLRVGAPPFVCHSILASLIRSFRSTQPGVTFDVVPGYVDELRQLVNQNRLDFALGPISLQQDKLQLETNEIVRLRHAIVCRPSHPLRLSGILSLEALGRAEWISHSERSGLHEVMRSCMNASGIAKIAPAVRSGAAGTVLNLLRQTDSLTILPIFSIFEQLEMGELAVLPFPICEVGVAFGVITHALLPGTRVRDAFMAHCAVSLSAFEARAEAFLCTAT